MTDPSVHTWRTTLFLGLALTGVLGPGARAACAQDVTSLHDTFVWDSTAGDDAARAIEAALADLSPEHREFASAHLRRAIEPYRTVTIEQDGEAISIGMDGAERIRAPASGQPIAWTRPDGKRMRVSITREDGAIRQTFTAEDQERENLFRASADGRSLTMTVTVRMDRLADPIRYEAVYRQHEDGRVRQYLWSVAGPGTLVGTFLVAGADQLFDVPDAWDRNMDGYGRRVASRWGRFAVQTTTTHGLAAALDRPIAYRRCGCSGKAQRVVHALLGTITDPGSEGGRMVALPRIAGVYAGAFADLAFTPEEAGAGDALISGTSWIATSALANLLQEFIGTRIPLFGAKIPGHGSDMSRGH